MSNEITEPLTMEESANSPITRIIPLCDQNLMLNSALLHLDANNEIRQSDITHLMAKLANKKYPAEKPWTADDFNEFVELGLGFTWGFHTTQEDSGD